MSAVKLLKNVLKNISLKMQSKEPGVYHPIDHETPTGELADRLSKVSILIHSEEGTNPVLNHQINYLFAILESRKFDFGDENYSMLWKTNKNIYEMRNKLSREINEEKISSHFETECRSLHVKTMVRESLIAAISIHYVAK